MLSLDVDVTRETTQPGDFASKCNDDSGQGNEESDENQCLPEARCHCPRLDVPEAEGFQ